MGGRTSVYNVALLAAVVCAVAMPACAQTAGPPAYTPQVWDMDWSYLRDAASARSFSPDWSDRLHYIALGQQSYVSVTGQVRERGEYQDWPGFGAQPPDNGYLLQRYLLSTDLHLTPHFRAFLQMNSGLINGRDGGPRPAIDEDRLDFNQVLWT